MIKADGHLFKEDGERFIPIGHNIIPGGADLNQYFSNMRKYGENTIRILYGDVGSGQIEDSPGVIRQDWYDYMDVLTEAATNNGIRLLLSPWSWWSKHYDSVPGKFFGTEARKIHMEIMYRILGRYGKMDCIFAWELYNEIGGGKEEINSWVDAIASFCKSNTEQMLTLSAGTAWSSPTTDQVWVSPYLDFASAHAYNWRYLWSLRMWSPSLSWIPNFNARIAATKKIMEIVRENTQKPFLDTEVPGVPLEWWRKVAASLNLWRGTISNALYEENQYDVLKAYLDAGAAGPGLPWICSPMQMVDGISDTMSQAGYESMKKLSILT